MLVYPPVRCSSSAHQLRLAAANPFHRGYAFHRGHARCLALPWADV